MGAAKGRFGERHTIGTVLDTLADEEKVGLAGRYPFPTGFEPLDTVLGGGVRAHDLMLIGGAPGVGKTILALQWARHMALSGTHVLYVSYEHEPSVMAARLLSLEMGMYVGAGDVASLERAGQGVYDAVRTGAGLLDLARREPLLGSALERLERYESRLHLVQGSGAHTGLDEIRGLLTESQDVPSVLVLDYLQKVAVKPEPASEAEKVLRVAEGLKDMALELDVSVVAVTAADQVGLSSPRLRLHHMRGSTALAYECDTAMMLNEKQRIVAKAHMAYDPVRAKTFQHQVVFSVEKNRGGPNLQELEFTKHFSNFRFDPDGGYVAERLINERIDEE